MRLFAAIDLNDEVREAIAAEQKRVAAIVGKGASLRWVLPAHMHLTLAFLGEVAEAAVPQIVDALSPNFDIAPFTAVFQHLGVFPPRGAPRVLWLGMAEGASQTVGLQRQVAQRLERVGVPPEPRPFHPHLTLGRWRSSRPSDARRALVADRQAVVARLRVDGVTLYQSQLGPAGPTHTARVHATLT
ncbi:MAG: RNA 2',3'-cyclic phosphodiesterase [Vicinamibacterales bacterium]